MRGTWQSRLGGWGLALLVVVALSAGGAAAAGFGLAGSSRPAAAAGHPPRCSHKEPQVSAPDWPAAKHRLAPTGAGEIRLCRYSSLNSHPPLTLERARLLDRAGLVAQLVRRFDSLPRAPRRVFCPADDGSEILALVSYPNGRQVQISVALTGCEGVTNGSVNRTAAGFGRHPRRGPRLLAQLERLVDGRDSAGTATTGAGEWTVLARSPLHLRSDASVVWDGRELLELGGSPAIRRGSASRNAGAAFDPRTGRWHEVAPAPSAVRPTGNATVWTGRVVFVFARAAGLYNPATNRWTVARGAPVGPFNDATAVWTGRRVVLAGMTQGERLEVASYDPAADRWRRMPPPIPRGHSPLTFALVRTNRGVLLWSLWSRTQQLSPTTTTIYSGVDVFRLSDNGRWVTVTGHWPQHQTVDDPVFTGSRVLLAPGQIWCGACSHPPPFDSHGYVVNPRTLHLTQIPHGPLDDLGPQILWTGRAELSLNAGGEISGPGVHVRPGDLAAWDPQARKWAREPRAPMQLGDMPAVWTGKRLMVLARDGHLLAYTP